jgi:hypothetical protein
MSDREAYIAGRSGGRRPPDTSTKVEKEQGFGNREQAAYDAGQQERQRAQTIKEKGIAGLSQREQEQAKTIAEKTGKDPYNTLTNEEKENLPSFEDKGKGFNIQDTFDFFSKFSPIIGFGKGFGAFIDSLVKSPKAKQFTNPNDLAIIRSLFTNEQGEVDQDKLDDYYDQYKVTIGEGLTSDKASGEAAKFFKEQGIVDNEKAFQDFQKAIMGASPTGVEGMESELRLDPVNYYTNKDGGFNIPQTTGGLETMAANLTFDDIAKSGLSGAQRRRLGYELQQAREAGRDGRGGNQGIRNTPTPDPSDPTPDPTDPIPPQQPTLPPGFTPLPTMPKYPGSVITDYTQLGLPNIYGNQQMPNYANFYQGQQPVGLQDYLDNLRKRFGIG